MKALISASLGLMALGLGFVIIDFFIVKLLLKMYPDPKYWDEELNSPQLTLEQRRSLERRQNLYHTGVNHRFRIYGIILFCVGSLLLACMYLLPIFRNIGVSHY
jgi:hypothetical protein